MIIKLPIVVVEEEVNQTTIAANFKILMAAFTKKVSL